MFELAFDLPFQLSVLGLDLTEPASLIACHHADLAGPERSFELLFQLSVFGA